MMVPHSLALPRLFLTISVDERLAKRLSLKRCSGYENGFVDSVT
jgi:hypothetical protein